jgi:hypothetical protein
MIIDRRWVYPYRTTSIVVDGLAVCMFMGFSKYCPWTRVACAVATSQMDMDDEYNMVR